MSEQINQDSTEENVEALRQEYENAKERLNHQSEIFNRFARESLRMLRITLVFTGLLFAGLSAIGSETLSQTIISSDCSVHILSGCFTFEQLGLFFVITLLLSILAHVQGNEARGVMKTSETDDIDQILNTPRMSEKEYLISRLEKYNHRIKVNEETLNVFESILGIGKGSFAISTTLLVVIIYAASVGAIRSWVIILTSTLCLLTIRLFMLEFPEEYLDREVGNSRMLSILRRIWN